MASQANSSSTCCGSSPVSLHEVLGDLHQPSAHRDERAQSSAVVGPDLGRHRLMTRLVARPCTRPPTEPPETCWR